MGDSMNLDFLWDAAMLPNTFTNIMMQLRRETAYSACWKTKCLSLRKIFKVVSHFPEIYVDFSLKILPCVTEILENMLIFYMEVFHDVNLPLTSPAELDENIKDLFDLIDDTIRTLSSVEDSSTINSQSLLCMGIGNLLMTCLNHLEKGRIGHLSKPRFIESCKVYYKFLEQYDPEFIIGHIHPLLESMIGCLNNFSSDDDGVVAVVRFIMESCRKSSMVSRIVKIIPGESPAFLSVLSTIVQHTDDDDKLELAKDPKIFPQLKRALKSSNTSEIKYATFFMKSLTSYFASKKEYVQLKPEDYSELLLNLSQSDFMKYWTNFFDLFEVLEEKQIHIIQPFFPKLDNLKLPYEACADWYFVVVYKMLQHDNRGVAKEGATKFIEYAEIISTSSYISEEKAKAHLFQFIMKTILPILKDHVGWIFKEGEEFFGYAKRLGKVLSVIYRQHGGEVLLTEKILGYIKSAEKGLSAHFLFFLMLTVDSANEEIVSLNSCLKDEVNNPDISLAFELVVNCLNHSLTTIDKFMSREIQKALVNITVTLLRFDKTKVHFRPSTFFLFIGGLSQEIFCDIRCFNKLKAGCFDAVEGKKLTESTGITSNESLTSTLGQLRCLFVPWLDDKESSLLDLFQISRLKQKEKRSGGVYTYFISDLYQCFNLLKINQIHSSEFLEYVNPYIEGEVNGIWNCFKTAAKIILDGEVAATNFVSIIRELHSLRLICNTSGRIKENLSNAIFMENHCLKFRFGSCILSNFLLCKLWLIITQICPEETLRDKLPVISFEGFEAFFLSESVDDNLAIASLDDELFVDFLGGENVLSILYQLKFNVFASIISISYPNYTCLLKLDSYDVWKKFLSVGLDNMDLAGKYGVIAAAPFFIQSSRCIKDLQFGDLEEMLENFVKLSWKHLDEQRKTEVFWQSFTFLVDYMTTTYSIQRTDTFITFAENVLKYGETIMGMSIVLMEGLKRWTKRFLFPATISHSTITEHKNIYENLLHVCVLVATYGPPMVKTLKVDFQLWEWLISRNSDYNHDNILNANNFTSAAQSRILAILLMQVIFDKVDDKNVYLNYVVDKLLKINEEESIVRKRYFNNSTSHRLKQRISQTLLVLQHLFTREVRTSVTKQLLGSLANDSSQPSVRYLMEWVIIRNLACGSEDWDMFFEESVKCSRAREGFGAFFATICLHTIPMLRNDESSKTFFTKALTHLTDLLLGKHFTVRVYSLISFRTIYETALGRGWKSVIQPFEVIYKSLDNFCQTGNFTRIHQNIVNDFYVNLFHAETNHNFPVIFIHLPRIAGMANDEIIPELTLKQLYKEFVPTGIFEKQNCPSLECDEKLISSYKDLTESVWLFRAVLDGRELGEMTPIETQSSEPPPEPEPCSSSSVINLQKKMNPWKFLPISDDISEFPEQLQLKKKNLSDDGLVVVASLIDRVPNLGGLCRTCEIFGVSKYVISSMKVLDDAQFKNLSVSAHNWVDLLEVPVKDLETFLASYASKGYSIVGVEQAIESAGLNSFTFPKKTLLLLGNEKFGIPTNLLHLVDQCLEIPQVGVIRSLNVHVTGALCIWQYACQHSI